MWLNSRLRPFFQQAIYHEGDSRLNYQLNSAELRALDIVSVVVIDFILEVF